MKFQDSQVELRLRTPDEAVDVGVLLARKYWWPLLGGWAVVAIPFFCVACFIPYTFWALVFFWWFKPLYERLPLQVVSSAIFQQKYYVKPAFRDLLQYDTLSWLTIYRICPGRSTLTPIAALEGLESGTGQIRKRRQIIKSPIISTYFLLHAGMFLCEFVILWFGAILYMKFFEPVFDETLVFWELFGMQWNWAWNTQSGRLLLLSLMLTSSAFMAPFYVCAGFGLYINRRIGLEGWDLYLGFQRLISQLSIVCVVLLITFPTIEVVAQDATNNTTTSPSSQIQVRAEIDEIIQEHIVREETIRRPKLESSSENENDDRDISDWLTQVISRVIIWLLVIMIVGLIIWVIIKLRIWEFVKKRSRANNVSETDVTIVEDEYKGFDLPSNVVSEASLAWQQGRAREALSLLYRGALVFLIVKHSCPIEFCDTERTCARVISRRAPTLSSVFNKLSLNWQQVAYGKKELGDQEFQLLISLYEDSFA